MVYDDADVRAVLAADGSTVEAWWPPGTAELVGARSLNLLTPPRHPEVKTAFTRAFGERAVAAVYLAPAARAAATVLDAWAAAAASPAAAPADPGATGDSDGGRRPPPPPLPGGGSWAGSGAADAAAAAAAAALGDLPAGRRALPLCDFIASATFHAALLGPPPSLSDADPSDAEAAAAAAALVKAAVDRAALAGALTGGFTPPMVDAPFTAYGRARRARQALLADYASALKAARNSIGTGKDRGSSAPAATAIESLAQAMAGSSSSSGAANSAAGPTEEEVLDGVFACLFGNAGAGPTMVKLLQHISPPPGLGSNSAQDQGSSGAGAAAAAAVWWERLREEQRGVVAAAGPRLSAAALDAMPLAEAAVREALRISPVVPAMFRQATADFEIRGRCIPAGWRVWLHTGPGVLRYNRDEFDPARWLSVDGGGTGVGGLAGVARAAAEDARQQQQGGEEKEGQEEEGRGASGSSACPFAGLTAAAGGRAAGGAAGGGGSPFGGGTRACVGRPLMLAQLKLLLALLVRRYWWSSAAGAGEPWVVVPAPRPAEGLAGFELRWLAQSEAIPAELGD